MKKNILQALVVSCLFIATGIARAATVTWASTNTGDWNVATNWIPVHVPAPGDDVIITNAGTYSVTNAPSVTLDSLILGGTNGIQTLNLTSVTLTNAGIVNSNGVLNWSGGDLVGALTVAQGGTLSISKQIYFDEVSPYTNNAALTNYGTVICAGSIASYANEGSLGGSATIDNAGLWESVGDNSISVQASGGTNTFINTGTLEKIGGTGTSTLNWSFINNSGTVNTLTGSFSMGNWINSGLVHGNAAFSSGTIAGTLAPGATMNFSATVNAALTVSSNAVANWNGGDLVSSLTVLQGGTLSISNTVYFDEASPYTNNAALTNYGTVIWAGYINSYANEGSLGGSATIDNAGLWESVGDNSISVQASGGTNTFLNTGTLEKISGTGTSTLNWNFINNNGTVNTLTGSFSMGNWINSGLVHGNATFSGGTIAGTLASDCLLYTS